VTPRRVERPRARGRSFGRTRHRPRKRFGQHFLSPAWANKVVAAIAPAPGDAFLEIGPGQGAITLPLAETGLPILAIEIDRDLASDLASRAPANVTILARDALEVDVMPLLSGLLPLGPPDAMGHQRRRRLRVAGNLPYNITSPIFSRLLALHQATGLLHDATVMVQKEVADRLLARPGTRDYGVLTVLMSVRTRISRLFDLPPGAFTPAPAVRSTLLRLEFTAPTVRLPDEQLFNDVVKAIFGKRRKTVANALKAFDRSAPDVLAEAGIDGRRRPGTLQVQEIARVAERLAARRRPPVV
jgi:16S rRNA (adenine1518-N6/adenine1519-N6)-dimethyltransferase